MKKLILIPVIAILFLFTSCTKDDSQINKLADPHINQEQLSACEQVGGTISTSEECDGSKLEWCEISKEEQCYADQIQNGKCPKNISPRVLCNNDLEKNDFNNYKKCETDIDCFGISGCGAGCYSKRPPKDYFSQDDCDDLLVADESCVCIDGFCTEFFEENLESIQNNDEIAYGSFGDIPDHMAINYKIEVCENNGEKQTRNGLDCECVEFYKSEKYWICNEKVICGNEYLPLEIYKQNKCQTTIIDFYNPNHKSTGGIQGCAGFNCIKDTLVFEKNNKSNLAGNTNEKEYFDIFSDYGQITIDAKFHTDACQNYYSYIKEGNHIKIIQNLKTLTCDDIFTYSYLKAKIVGLEKGDYKLSIYYKHNEKSSWTSTELKEVFSKNFTVK